MPQLSPSSPTRPSRHKRESSTITRSTGKALVDVMNKDKATAGSGNVTDSDAASNVPSGPVTRRAAATTREASRGSRPSLDLPRASSGTGTTPKLVKRPPTAPSSFPLKPTTRQDKSVSDESPSKPSEKVSKPRASLSLRGLSSALQSKSSRAPSALPKYNPKQPAEAKAPLPRSSVRKRLNDSDKEEDEVQEKGNARTLEEDGDDDFVTVERPISPLPRRAARKPMLPVSLSLTPSTPPKKGNVLHKQSGSISSPNRPLKASKGSSGSITPISRLQTNQISVSRPSSSASAHSQRTTPMKSPTRKPVSVSRAGTTASFQSVRRRPTLTEDSSPSTSTSRLDASPRNPFQLPETSGSSLLSPPLSPFLEGVSLDSIDAGDVSAFLSTVVSPTKPSTSGNREAPPQTPSRHEQILPDDLTSPPPQTPATHSTLRPPSILTTDPRQSLLSLRQYLENSGDLEHLLSQPLPAVLTPDARERLLSFGFSPGFVPPPFPRGSHRPEPQTPSPAPDGRSFTSISQVLFPPAGGDTQKPPGSELEDGALVDLLKMQLISAEAQRAERDARIEQLETQLLFAREAREQEAAELSTQVSDLEHQLEELLGDRRERVKESDRRMEDFETLLRDKDDEWEHHVTTLVAQVQEQCLADQERIVDSERRKSCVHSATAAWELARTTALNELELVRSNKSFIEVTLAGLELSIQQLRRSSAI